MPLEYFKIKLKDGEKAINISKLPGENNKAASFIFYNQLYKEAIKRQIEFGVERGILTYLLENE